MMKTHPHFRNLDGNNVKVVVKFLQQQNFTREQIFEAVHLVLYPIERIASKLSQLSHRDDMQPFSEKRQHPSFLQTLLYFIEEEHNFSGSGVFATVDTI